MLETHYLHRNCYHYKEDKTKHYASLTPYSKNTEDVHTLAKLDPINITIYTRGNQIEHKIINILRHHIHKHNHDHEQIIEYT